MTAIAASETMSQEDLTSWLRLTLTPGIDNSCARRLLAAFGWPGAVFTQSAASLRQIVTQEQALALLIEPEGLGERVQACQAWLAGSQIPGLSTGVAIGQASDNKPGRVIVPLGDARYPPSLLTIDDPPILLYMLGRIDLLDAYGWPTRCLAMVGESDPTSQGWHDARDFARAFTQKGICLVGGLALGIEGAAHDGAMSEPVQPGGGGPVVTIAVIGTGINLVHPRQHHDLAHRISKRGLIMSEMPLSSPSQDDISPKRNRLIVGLSQGVLVVEARSKAQSLQTAMLAIDQGKEVFAIPGSIHSPRSHGCHALIRQGAKIVENIADVIGELHWEQGIVFQRNYIPPKILKTSTNDIQPDTKNSVFSQSPTQSVHRQNGANAHDRLLDVMGEQPIGIDALLVRTGLDEVVLQARLLDLQMNGRISRLPGNIFQRQEMG